MSKKLDSGHLSTLAYLGSRAGATSSLRWELVDLDEGWATLHEKGRKVNRVPLPHAYLGLLRELIAAGALDPLRDEYVIPMARAQRRSGDRDHRVVWRIVKQLGKRAGLPARRVFPHAVRHAFSVRFLEDHPGEIEALQRLLGHAGIATTQRYIRAMERERLVERVRDLSWGTQFDAKAVEARTGIEPVYEALQASA